MSRMVAKETRDRRHRGAAAECSPLVIDVLREGGIQNELHEIPATAIAHEGDAAPVLSLEIADAADEKRGLDHHQRVTSAHEQVWPDSPLVLQLRFFGAIDRFVGIRISGRVAVRSD